MNQSENNKQRIVLSGGGTGGSVTPLLAIAESLMEKFPERFEFHWVGTATGIERRMTDSYSFTYHAIAAGKLRRYFSGQNFIDIINIIAGFFQSLNILIKLKPSLVISAGGFVTVPLAWAAKLLDIQVLIHQQDIRPGLANKLMAPCATTITTAFEKSLLDYGEKARWIGNPIRSAFKNLSPKETESNQILVLGGGTGSESLYRFVKNNIEKILEFGKVEEAWRISETENF
jgi:UDP-N-acetylglucosamine--N-acetylmuramyl-(pentapeptide) pyrophosphoryl-undecaprenol N-acetylglucosamine transferase